MKSILKQSLKLFTMSMAVAVIFTLSQSAAQAQLTVAGSTTGTFTDSGGTTTGTTLGGLSFSGTPFGGTTSGGVLDLNNLGTLTITPATIGDSFGSFAFRVAFTAPDGLIGSPVEVPGAVFGFYTDADTFALIDFNNDAQTVTFSGANGTGVFSLAVDDVCLFQGTPCETSDFTDDGPILTKLRRHKTLNALALNTQRGDGDVKFVKAKGSSIMFQGEQTFTITATITLTEFTPTAAGQCKDDGWKNFITPSFKNQGDCVSFTVPVPK